MTMQPEKAEIRIKISKFVEPWQPWQPWMGITDNQRRDDNKWQIFRWPAQMFSEPKFPGSTPFKTMPAMAGLFSCWGQLIKRHRSFSWEIFYFFPQMFSSLWMVGGDLFFVSLRVSDIIHIWSSITTLGVRKFKYLPLVFITQIFTNQMEIFL